MRAFIPFSLYIVKYVKHTNTTSSECLHGYVKVFLTHPCSTQFIVKNFKFVSPLGSVRSISLYSSSQLFKMDFGRDLRHEELPLPGHFSRQSLIECGIGVCFSVQFTCRQMQKPSVSSSRPDERPRPGYGVRHVRPPREHAARAHSLPPAGPSRPLPVPGLPSCSVQPRAVLPPGGPYTHGVVQYVLACVRPLPVQCSGVDTPVLACGRGQLPTCAWLPLPPVRNGSATPCRQQQLDLPLSLRSV